MLKFNLCRKAHSMKDKKSNIEKVQASFKDGIYLFACIWILLSIFNKIDIKIQPRWQVVQAQEIMHEEVKPVKPVMVTPAPDQRITKLKSFLVSKNSPLESYTELIIQEADKNDIGWTWIIGISCMESACGLKLPSGSYNAWGLGGSKFMYFRSWEESIKYMSQLIGTNYRHNILQGIKQNYCPASDGCNPNWSQIVAQASKDIIQ